MPSSRQVQVNPTADGNRDDATHKPTSSGRKFVRRKSNQAVVPTDVAHHNDSEAVSTAKHSRESSRLATQASPQVSPSAHAPQGHGAAVPSTAPPAATKQTAAAHTSTSSKKNGHPTSAAADAQSSTSAHTEAHTCPRSNATEDGAQPGPGPDAAVPGTTVKKPSTRAARDVASFVEPEQIQLSQAALLEQQRRQRLQEEAQHSGNASTTALHSRNGGELRAPSQLTQLTPTLKRTSLTGHHTSASGVEATVATTASGSAAALSAHFGSTTKAAPFAAAGTTAATAAVKARSEPPPGTGQRGVQSALASNTPPLKLSKRSLTNTQKVDEAVRRCMSANAEDPPTAEQQELYAMVRVVRMSPIGLLFVAHPEVIVSNRAGVIIARSFNVGDEVAVYRVTKILKPGTLGRSYQAVTLPMVESPTSKSSGLPDGFDERRFGGAGGTRQSPDVVLKVVSCVLRHPSVQKLITDLRKIMNIASEHVARVTDVLRDDLYNVVVCSEFHPHGNVCRFAGRLKTLEETATLRNILLDVAIGLHDLHSVKIAHHNVRLENVLQKDTRQFCLSDAGFSVLFATESPEALLFNGELAALPPEVFDPQHMYANDDWEGEVFPHLEKVDVWGFGVLMYQLAYGLPPIVISELSSVDAHHMILTAQPEFPDRPDWPFAAALNSAILSCLEKNPNDRPTMFHLLNNHEFFAADFAHRRRASARQHSEACASVAPSVALRTPSSFTINVGPNQTGRTSSTSSGGSSTSQTIVGYIVDEIVARSSEAETLRVHLRSNPSKEFAFKVAFRSLQARFKTAKLPAALLPQLAFSRKVQHPHLVTNVELIDCDISGLFIVQEFLRGGPLNDLPPVTAAPGAKGPTMQTLIADVLLALVHLHDNNVPHLSLSPSNIFYTEDKQRFKVTDYGCVCRTVEEMIDRATHTTCFDIPARITAEIPMNGERIDVFTLGLLAASAVPELFVTVWDQYRRVSTAREPLSVEHILQTLKARADKLPAALVDFATVALTKDIKVRELLKHPYMVPVVPRDVPIERVPLSQTELDEAVKVTVETVVENRLQKVLNYDPFHDALAVSSHSFDMIDANEDVKAVVVIIKGRKIKCAKCSAEMQYALYLCLDCKNYVCCGKCAVDNDHMEGHKLDAYILYTLEFLANGTTKVSLVHPSSIKSVHALETIEARENLPTGALTKRYAAHRALERSMRSVAQAAGNSLFQGVTEIQSEVGSDAGSESTNLLASATSSAIHAPYSAAGTVGQATGGIRPSNNYTRLKSLNSTSAYGVQLASSVDGMSPVNTGLVPSAPPKNSLLLGMKGNTNAGGLGALANANKLKTGKKLMLAKEADMDESPEEELEKCREKNSRELLLFNFSMTAVPRDVYDPPLTHLEVLDLKENLLTSLPDELSFLKNLRKLSVSYNKLTELPGSIGHLAHLKELDASHNELTSLPNTFIYLSALTSIVLDYNNFTEVPNCLLDIDADDSCEESYVATPSTDATITQSGRSMVLLPPGSAAASNTQNPGGVDRRHSTDSQCGASPRLSAIYMVANDNLTTFPSPAALRRFAKLQLCFDNEPSLFQFYNNHNLEQELPHLTVNWNKNYPDEIIPHLYCGSLRTTQSQVVYTKLDIEYVLTVGRGLQPMKPEGGQQKTVIVDDIPGADIRCSFEESVAFIDESQKRGKGCLVHCFAGLSRSATTVIAYLMMRKNMRLDEAYLVTKKGRPAILPNAGFFSQLLLLDKELFPNATRPLDIDSLGRPE